MPMLKIFIFKTTNLVKQKKKRKYWLELFLFFSSTSFVQVQGQDMKYFSVLWVVDFFPPSLPVPKLSPSP